MKSTRMVCSLVVLSSPLCIDAAASSTTPDALHWEIVQAGSLISRTQADHTKQPTAAAIAEFEEIQQINRKARLEAASATAITAHRANLACFKNKVKTGDIKRCQPPCNKDFSAESRLVLAQLRGTGYKLTPPVMLYNSSRELVELEANQDYTYVAKGNIVPDQDYIWTQKEIAAGLKTARVWRPKLALIPEENTQVATTITAMNNILAASVLASSYFGLSTQTMFSQARAQGVLSTDPSNRTAKDHALFDAQCAELASKATQLLAQIGITPKLGYYVRAVLEEFRRYSEENDEKVQTSGDIFKTAFGSTVMTKHNRPAVVALYAEVAGAVQDPYATGAWSYLGTNEPKEVTELNACNAALKEEANVEKIAALTARRDMLINAIHAEAVAGLNALVKQNPDKITSAKLRAENKLADSPVGELRNILRQLNELQTLQAVLVDREHRAAPSSSSC